MVVVGIGPGFENVFGLGVVEDVRLWLVVVVPTQQQKACIGWSKQQSITLTAIC